MHTVLNPFVYAGFWNFSTLKFPALGTPFGPACRNMRGVLESVEESRLGVMVPRVR